VNEATALDSASLRSVHFETIYDSDDALQTFYIPSLSRALRYDRSVGYFSSGALSAAAKGIARFIANGGRMRLVVGAQLDEDDCRALTGAITLPDNIAERLAGGLLTDDEVERYRLGLLGWMIRAGLLDMRIAVPVDSNNNPLPPASANPYWHEKVGIIWDANGEGVAFMGSTNETLSGWVKNYESFRVDCSWKASGEEGFRALVKKFDSSWAGNGTVRFKLFDVPEVIRRQLITYASNEAPSIDDPEEVSEATNMATLARYLMAVPKSAAYLQVAEATSGVRLFPHQRQVVRRLADHFPRSWIVADEVGLGKTISAGLALRALLLSDQVKKVLIMAPANVCRQWQDELFEKFGLWVPRLDGGIINGAHPTAQRTLAAGENPYATERVLLVSSHLARRREHRELILDAAPYDLVIVDEAHHARRSGADPTKARRTQLLQLLEEMRNASAQRALWLLTATPMQVDDRELHDLLCLVGLGGRLAEYFDFKQYYTKLAAAEAGADLELAWFHACLSASPVTALDELDLAVRQQMRVGLGPVRADEVAKIGSGAVLGIAESWLNDNNVRAAILTWLRHAGPVGRLITRHTRATLRKYRDQGLLSEPIADRAPQVITIDFEENERRIYDALDEIIDSLMSRHSTRKGAGFVLAVYRRRLTSSWQAIGRTLERRLRREEKQTWAGGPPVSWDWDEDEIDEELEDINEAEALPLSEEDIAALRAYLAEIETVTDSKIRRLLFDINTIRSKGERAIIFTQYTDTLDLLRDTLKSALGPVLATYTGDGGRITDPDGNWISTTKQDLIARLRSGDIDLILATDAASEGLNLQAASYLINYDLPWNPMRVEQRIGRIDRIGQQAPVVAVLNYVIPGTVEQEIYNRLAERIDLFSGIVGHLQPILGAAEDAFLSAFRAPRSERQETLQLILAELDAKVESAQTSGLRLDDSNIDDDDLLPGYAIDTSPVLLGDIKQMFGEALRARLESPSQPATFEPGSASRDPQNWNALATPGHPNFTAALSSLMKGDAAAEALIIGKADEANAIWRGDVVPPVPVRSIHELAVLSDAVSSAEAAGYAREDAMQTAARRRQTVKTIEKAARSRADAQTRDRFHDIVKQACMAQATLLSAAGTVQPSAAAVLFALRERGGGWQNLDNLAGHLHQRGLNVPLDEWCAQALAVSAPETSEAKAGRQLERCVADLTYLASEWYEKQQDSPTDV
jgi:superfamily II DNA or RNA helicase